MSAQQAVVTVQAGATVIDRYLGMGVQWDPYEYAPTEAAWQLTFDRLDSMKPSFFRVMLGANYCLGFDEEGQPHYVWEAGEDAATQKLQPLMRILDYAQSRRISVMLGEWGPPGESAVKSGGPIRGPADPRWARIIRDFVVYLSTVRRYTVLRYYNYMNEPNGSWMWPQSKVDYKAWATGMRNLRKEFNAHQLAWLPIAGPDNSGSWDWVDRCARDLRNEIGLWEMHWHATDREVTEGAIEKLLADKRRLLEETDPDLNPYFHFELHLRIFRYLSASVFMRV
jgi:hypothetical protein